MNGTGSPMTGFRTQRAPSALLPCDDSWLLPPVDPAWHSVATGSVGTEPTTQGPHRTLISCPQAMRGGRHLLPGSQAGLVTHRGELPSSGHTAASGTHSRAAACAASPCKEEEVETRAQPRFKAFSLCEHRERQIIEGRC